MYSWKPYLAAAILLIVALVAGNYLFNGRAGNSATKRLHTEISQVVEKELYSISEETILEVLGDEHQNSSGDESASAGEVIDYLLNEDIQENELMNAL
jgi:hypothetical protein